MIETFLSVFIALAFNWIFLSLVAWCKSQNDLINLDNDVDIALMNDLSCADDDLFFGKPYVGWTEEQIESYEHIHLRSDILGY